MKQQDQKNENLFSIMQAVDWLPDSYAPSKMLFGHFWFEGELCILFADTNVGKSILAVQIANSLAAGSQVGEFKNEMAAGRVLYFDFEHAPAQFGMRYTSGEGKFSFSNALYRAQLNPDDAGNDLNDTNSIKEQIEIAIAKTAAKILIIDNLTYLQNETGNAKDALLLMQHLKSLKSRYNLSILALAHTPKRRGCGPITQNDLLGSKMLINFCDSAFAIGRSKNDPDMRYLKQIKQRNSVEEYGEDNVPLFKIVKTGNGLAFEFVEFDGEYNHCRRQPTNDRDELLKSVVALNKRGFSQRRIALRLGISASTVCKTLQRADGYEEHLIQISKRGEPKAYERIVTINGVIQKPKPPDGAYK